MDRYQSPLIADLAAQLVRGPRRLSVRQLSNIEFLLSVIEAGKSYPLDFILHALTGFRARNGDRRGSTLLSEEVIRTDLVTLAEDISAAADIPADCFCAGVYTVSGLARRFDVSTKTIFRWHRRGLIGWRLRFDDRRMRLAFPDRCVRWFVAKNLELVHRGSSFSQLTKAERENIVACARQLVDSGERTVNAVAKVIAGETNRAVETIRLILKSYDQTHPKSGVFNRSKLKVDADDDRLRIWEAYSDGVSLKALGRRFGRSADDLYRVITEMRARELQARTIEFVPSDEFGAPNADEEILNDPAAAAPTNGPTPTRRTPSDLPPYLQQLFRIALLTPEGERALFRKFNYLKYKADLLRQWIDPENVNAQELDRVEDLLEQARKLKAQITQANLRLVVSIAKRHATPLRDFFEIVSDGNVSLMRAVEKFDYSRGFKFSTYASWAVIKNYARTIPEHKQHLDRYQTGRDELLEHVSGPVLDEHESDYLPTVHSTLDRMLGTLDQRERDILRQRFGLDEHREPRTLQQVGKHFGVSKERIRQLEARAMSKLRGEFADQVEPLLTP
ncbi:MAG: sigma-70 family RNA polymerase sigma factor [Planctomycetes bacterium]|nr:sigma-70 family RNA polymerase sigma factor [Planctomycetota bacterium]